MTDVTESKYPNGWIQDNARTEGDGKNFLEDLRDALLELPGGRARSTLNVVGGSITPTGAVHDVDTEGSTNSDYLDHIAYTNHPEGRLVVLRQAADSRVVTVRNGQGGDGQIFLSGDKDATLLSTGSLVLQRVSNAWREILRQNKKSFELANSDGGATEGSTLGATVQNAYPYNPVDENTWYGVGPTGSGQYHEWAALDAVPADATWIELKVRMQCSNLNDGLLNGFIYGRPGGSGLSRSYATELGELYTTSDAATQLTVITNSAAKLALGPGKTFDVLWRNDWGNFYAGLRLVGWGYD